MNNILAEAQDIPAAEHLPPNDVLREMYGSREVRDDHGNRYPLAGETAPGHTTAIYKTIQSHSLRSCLEIGMAYGGSTLSILTALEQSGRGNLISIDPNQSTNYKSIGRSNVQRAGLQHRHTVIEEPGHLALPDLLRKNTRLDFAYIDGWHTFDYALLDFFYIDKMLNTGGIVAFNDCGWAAVHRVIQFVLSHRRYVEIDAGLGKQYQGRNVAYSIARRLLGRQTQDRYLTKSEDWEPRYNFYSRF